MTEFKIDLIGTWLRRSAIGLAGRRKVVEMRAIIRDQRQAALTCPKRPAAWPTFVLTGTAWCIATERGWRGVGYTEATRLHQDAKAR